MDVKQIKLQYKEDLDETISLGEKYENSLVKQIEILEEWYIIKIHLDNNQVLGIPMSSVFNYGYSRISFKPSINAI